MQNSSPCSTTDFNKELLELLCQTTENDGDANICLISNTPLTDNSVKLCCGHQFNYNDIYKEIHYQKKLHHNYETQKLYTNQIKCPYCRTVQNGLLPWYEGKNKCTGVNWPVKYQYKPNKCTYAYLSGKRKGQTCNKGCYDKYCSNHEKIIKIRLEKQKQKQKQKQKLKKTSKIKNKIKSSNLTYKRLMRKKKAELRGLADKYGIGFLAGDTKKILSNNILTKHNIINLPAENIIIQPIVTI